MIIDICQMKQELQRYQISARARFISPNLKKLSMSPFGTELLNCLKPAQEVSVAITTAWYPVQPVFSMRSRVLMAKTPPSWGARKVHRPSPSPPRSPHRQPFGSRGYRVIVQLGILDAFEKLSSSRLHRGVAVKARS